MSKLLTCKITSRRPCQVDFETSELSSFGSFCKSLVGKQTSCFSRAQSKKKKKKKGNDSTVTHTNNYKKHRQQIRRYQDEPTLRTLEKQ